MSHHQKQTVKHPHYKQTILSDQTNTQNQQHNQVNTKNQIENSQIN